MTICGNCGRPIPCGCPNPLRPDTALSSLFGLVCDNCDAYNDPGQGACAQCGQALHGPNVVATRAARPVSGTIAAAPATAAQIELPTPLPPAPAPTPPEPRPFPAAIPVATPAMGPFSNQRTPAVLTVPLPRPSAPSGLSPIQLGQPVAPPVLQPTPLKLDQPLGSRPPGQAIPLALTQVVKSESGPCARCGTVNPPDFRFCTECGNALKPAAAKVTVAPAQPVAVGKAAARVLRGDKLGQTLRIGMQATAGRAHGPLSFPGDPFLAPYHCTLFFQQNRFFVRDEGSPSGTFVRLRDEEPLAPGDYFAIGDHLMRYMGPLTAEMHASDGTKILGCPRPPGLAVQIEEVHEGSVAGRNSVRLAPSITIGRDDGCDLSFSGDPFVSGRHCNITVGTGGRARIRDLGSTNGTFRRLESGSERELLKGDCIRVGSEVLQIVEEPMPMQLETSIARKIG